MKERVTIARLRCGNTGGFFRKQCAGLLHRYEHVGIAAHPGEILGPAASFHMEAAVFFPELLDQRFQGARAGGFAAKAVPDPLLQNWLDRREVFLMDSGCGKILQVLGHIHRGRIRSGSFADDLVVFRRKLIHHHTAVFTVRDLSHQRWD